LFNTNRKVHHTKGFSRKRYQKSFEMKQVFLIILTFLSFTSFGNVTSSFTCSNVKGCSPLVVSLTDHSTGSITSRHWYLGNGNSSTQSDPSATYLTPGVYMVKLIVSNGTTTDTSTQTITVFSPPSANFTSDKTTACPGDSFHFSNQAVAGSSPVSQYAWGFGNGVASSDTNAIYRYPQSGTYDVTLVVQDTNGCNAHMTKTAYITVWPKPTAAYTGSPIYSCNSSQLVNFTNQSTGGTLTYSWSFGDNISGSSANPSHTYSYGVYQAQLIVSNSYGCVDTTHQGIAVTYLKADFIASKTTVCAGEAVTFLNRSPMSGSSWHWNFGDGTTSSKQNPAKVYSQPGVYSVTFIVSSATCTDSATKVAYITVTAGFSVGFAADTQSSCSTPFLVNFASHVPGGVTLTWNFGDGHTSSATAPSNTYNGSGLYTVTLTAVDSLGCTVVASAPSFINTSMPSTKFTSDSLFCLGSHVQFINRTINGVKYLWNFGDGDTSTQVNPNHTYNSYGLYTVSLTAWDSIGCDSTFIRPSYIRVDSTVVGFDVDEKFSMCPPLVSIFSSHANRPDLTYLWSFGDGYTDTAANPTHIYFHPGVYTVKLVGTSKYGCTNTLIDSNLIVVQGPSGTFTMNPNTGCIPVDVTFSAHPSANTQTVICDLGDGTLYTDSLNFNYTYNSVNIFHPKFILTDQIGCSVPYALDSIITHGVPTVSINDTSICAGKNVSIGLANGMYQWKSRSVQDCDTCGTILHVCDTCGAVVLQPADTTIYTVTETNSFGCSASGHFQVNVAALPILSAQDTIKLCKNATVQMNVVRQAYSVTWTPATYLSNAFAFAPTCTPAESVDYIVTASNRLGCVVSQTVPVKVYDSIPLSITQDTAVCAGSPVQLNAFVTDTFFHGVNYSWKSSPYLSNTAIADPMATVQSETETFQVTASSGSCPIVIRSVTVAVNPSATVKLPANIVTSPFVELSITPVSGDLTTYNWSAKNDLTCAQCSTVTLTPTESQMVILQGTNQYGCVASDSMLIHVVNCDPASIFVPNTFTPNGDGTNDRLYVRSKTLAQMEYFQIFNRWGAIVYQTKSISEGWDGMINGKMAEEGVYVYQVSGKCENGYDVSTSGTVTLIR
jgi:gliding motility-associated-like protein